MTGDRQDHANDQIVPILLFNDECSVCRRIGHWVQKSAQGKSGEMSVLVQPIGDDPEALRQLNPGLNIWDAYAVIHILMPDGSMKVGGEAVAEVLRRLDNTKWFAWCFAVRVLGMMPFQAMLNLSYTILADTRSLFGCESCGAPSVWVRPLIFPLKWLKRPFRGGPHPSKTRHFTTAPVARRQPRAGPP